MGVCDIPEGLEPAIKARQMKWQMEAIESLPEAQRRAIQSLISPEVLAAVRNAVESDWLPLQVTLELGTAVYTVLEEADADRLFRAIQRSSFANPLLLPALEFAFKVMGMDPSTVWKRLPTGWALVFRNCGVWTMDRVAPGEADLSLSRVPDPWLRSPVALRSIAASQSAVFDLTRVQGTLKVANVKGDTVSFEGRWRPRSAPKGDWSPT